MHQEDQFTALCNLQLPPSVRTMVQMVEANPAHYLVKEKPHRQVYIVRAETNEGGIVLKYFCPQLLRRKLKAALTPIPTAAREYWISKYLLANGIPTAEPLAWCTSQYRSNSYFIAALLPSTTTLEEFLSFTTTHTTRQEALKAYATLLARLHTLGLYIDDFGLHNVIIKDTPTKPSLWVIDHEATRPLSGYLPKQRKKNLISGVSGLEQDLLSEDEVRLFRNHYQEQFSLR